MDRLSSRSRFLVQCVLDKNHQENLLEEQNHLAFVNARNDLFELQDPSKIQTIVDKREFKEDAIDVSESESGASVSNIKNVLQAMDDLNEIVPHNDSCIIDAQLNTSFEEYLNENDPPALGESNVPSSLFEVDEFAVVESQFSDALMKNKRQAKKTCYLVDYSDSDETNMDFSNYDSDKDPDFLISDLSDNEEENCLTRWKKQRTEKWKVNVTKKNRSACLPYENKSKACPAKKPKSIDCSKCRYDCSKNFSEEVREEICQSYWGLNDYNRQKDFIISHVCALTPKRRNTERNTSRSRQVAKIYYLENACSTSSTNRRHRVCASFFEKTLCISNGPINTALKGKSDTGFFVMSDKRGKKTPGNKTSEDNVAYVKAHIRSFPCIEAHYVRQSSKKLYLDPLLNIRKMYELYREMCNQNNRIPVKEPIYRRIFGTEFNLSFHTPKKDLCATCSKYITADPEHKIQMEAEYSLHLIRKTECNKAKEDDKERAKIESKFKTITFDLQSVLQLPFSAVSTFYYLRKLCVYNLTIYDEDGDAICNIWNEINGKRGSNEIGSIILKYISSIPEEITELSMFSDTCCGQNRNQQMAAALLYAVQNTHMEVIEQKFLESGHSHMECDSMHSAIENAKKYREIFMMKDWIDVFKMARSKRGNIKNKPYKVNELKFDDFYDLHALAADIINNRTHDTEGQKVLWLKIKCLKFEKLHPKVIFYRYDHTSDYKKIDVSSRSRRHSRQNSVIVELKQAYNRPLPISLQKKKDLEKLCKDGLIPTELHSWYQNLPVSNSLPDVDVVVFDE